MGASSRSNDRGEDIPGSQAPAWEPPTPKLRFVNGQSSRHTEGRFSEAELRGSAVPSRAWDRESLRVYIVLPIAAATFRHIAIVSLNWSKFSD